MSSKVDLDIPHPFGVRPSGNAFFSNVPAIRSPGLGKWGTVDDERVLDVLSFLDANDLSIIMQTSRALYAFCNADDLWRTLCLSSFGADWAYAYDWRTTFVRRASGRSVWSYSPIRVEGLFSDLLYKPHLCAAALPDSPAWLSFSNVPRESIAHLTLADFRARYEQPCLPVLLTGLGPHGEGAWPAYSKWTDEYLTSAFGTSTVHAAGFDMSLSVYLSYIWQASGQGQGGACPREEAPLYLFDKAFAAKAPCLAQDYTTPLYFREDLFSVLGPSEGDPPAQADGASTTPCIRPDYRWLIFGPKRSGSVFHKDPNGTSAWNAPIRGRKKWILWPPDCPPPGVYSSADGSEVATSMSIMEWMCDFYGQSCKERDRMWRSAGTTAGGTAVTDARKRRKGEGAAEQRKAKGRLRLRKQASVARQESGASCSTDDDTSTSGALPSPLTTAKGPYECVCEPGECMFVPRGWWHAVLNLDDSVAITQNFVSPVGASHTLAFLHAQPYAVSGLPQGTGDGRWLIQRWLEALKAHRPEDAALLEGQLKAGAGERGVDGADGRLPPARPAWTDLLAGKDAGTAVGTHGGESTGTGFSFTFSV